MFGWFFVLFGNVDDLMILFLRNAQVLHRMYSFALLHTLHWHGSMAAWQKLQEGRWNERMKNSHIIWMKCYPMRVTINFIEPIDVLGSIPTIKIGKIHLCRDISFVVSSVEQSWPTNWTHTETQPTSSLTIWTFDYSHDFDYCTSPVVRVSSIRLGHVE